MALLQKTKIFSLLVADLLIFLIAIFLTHLIRRGNLANLEDLYIVFIPVIFAFLIINLANGLYELPLKNHWRRCFESGLIGFFVGVLIFYLEKDRSINPKTILFFTTLLSYLGFGAARNIFRALSRQKTLSYRTIFIGFPKEAAEMVDLFKKNPEHGIIPLYAMGDQKQILEHGLKFLTKEELDNVTENEDINLIIWSEENNTGISVKHIYREIFKNKAVVFLSELYEQQTRKIMQSEFEKEWFLRGIGLPKHPFYRHLSLVSDYLAAILIGIFFIASFPIIALLIKATSKGPVFYSQERVGLMGKKFKIHKYRSMYALNKDGSAELKGAEFAQKTDRRITPVGKILRKLRLDELPQVVNLLKREITLIGPRPERPEFVEELTNKIPLYPLRHMIRPGLTGWALIQQGYTDNMEKTMEKLQYDLYYLKNRSIFLDLLILIKTTEKILRMKGQ